MIRRVAFAFMIWSFSLTLSYGLEFHSMLETALFSTKKHAFLESKVMMNQILTGKNQEALWLAAERCPEDNAPQFTVEQIQIVEYWLPTATTPDEVTYRGRIEYVTTCVTLRRG